MIGGSVAAMGALRPGTGERDAADIIHALASPEVYRLLVIDRGWTVQRYQEWLAATLAGPLLPPLPEEKEDVRHQARQPAADHGRAGGSQSHRGRAAAHAGGEPRRGRPPGHPRRCGPQVGAAG